MTSNVIPAGTAVNEVTEPVGSVTSNNVERKTPPPDLAALVVAQQDAIDKLVAFRDDAVLTLTRLETRVRALEIVNRPRTPGSPR
jgi:hypothetical protein